MVQMPDIATRKEIAAYLKMSPKRVSNLRRDFLPGIVIGDCRFNIDRLSRYIKREGRFLKTQPKINNTVSDNTGQKGDP